MEFPDKSILISICRMALNLAGCSMVSYALLTETLIDFWNRLMKLFNFKTVRHMKIPAPLLIACANIFDKIFLEIRSQANEEYDVNLRTFKLGSLF